MFKLIAFVLFLLAGIGLIYSSFFELFLSVLAPLASPLVESSKVIVGLVLIFIAVFFLR